MMDNYRTPGLVIPPSKRRNEEPTQAVQRQEIRDKGKEVCKFLRKMRQELAAVNGISFYPEICMHSGPCAGTCEVCDREIDYINKEINKIPSEQRIYPDMYMKYGNEGPKW